MPAVALVSELARICLDQCDPDERTMAKMQQVCAWFGRTCQGTKRELCDWSLAHVGTCLHEPLEPSHGLASEQDCRLGLVMMLHENI